MPSNSGNHTCEDCQKSFPLLISVNGKCKRCTVADTKEYQSPEWQQVLRWPQCAMCGVSAKNMMPPLAGHLQTCDASQCVALVTDQPAGSISASQTQAARHDLPSTIGQRSGLLFDQLASAHGVHGSSSGMTTESLQARENIIRTNANILAGKKDDAYIVEIKYRLSTAPKRISDTYGFSRIPFPAEATLYDVQDYGLAQFNVVHTKQGAREPVLVSETFLRQSENRTIESDHMALSLRRWFDSLAEDGLIPVQTQSAFGVPKPGAKKVAPASLKRQLSFELFVLMDMYAERLERDEQGLVAARKRQGRSDSLLEASGTQGASKYAKTHTGLPTGSVFSATSHSALSAPAVTSTRVRVQKIKCSALSPQGDPIFEKRDETTAFIRDEPFARGSMKAVFEIVFPHQGGNRYVAKRFITLQESSSSGGSSVSPPLLLSRGPARIVLPKAEFGALEHNGWIQKECAKLKQGKVILKEFKSLCSSKGVYIFKNLQFAGASLYQEKNSEPSLASGLAPSDDIWDFSLAPLTSEDGEDSSIMWLVEKRHTTGRVERFSGTLIHPSNQIDALHLTVYAFNHYAYGYSNGEMIFADLQGTPCSVRHENGATTEGFELFDPMMHTVGKSSGIGDHGQGGINTFLKQHKCREICTKLGLDTDYPLAAPTAVAVEDDHEAPGVGVDGSGASSAGDDSGSVNDSESD